MSSPEHQIQTSLTQVPIETQELTPEQIRKLIELAQKEGKIEARYLLKLDTWIRQGTSFHDRAVFDVIFGDVETVELGKWDEGYPYRKGCTYLLIPKSVPAVVRWKNAWDYSVDIGEKEVIYVFTSEGWKEVLVRTTRRSDP
jgi:hypothetical protein